MLYETLAVVIGKWGRYGWQLGLVSCSVAMVTGVESGKSVGFAGGIGDLVAGNNINLA